MGLFYEYKAKLNKKRAGLGDKGFNIVGMNSCHASFPMHVKQKGPYSTKFFAIRNLGLRKIRVHRLGLARP